MAYEILRFHNSISDDNDSTVEGFIIIDYKLSDGILSIDLEELKTERE